MLELWGNVEYAFTAISSRFPLAPSGMDQMELFDM